MLEHVAITNAERTGYPEPVKLSVIHGGGKERKLCICESTFAKFEVNGEPLCDECAYHGHGVRLLT